MTTTNIGEDAANGAKAFEWPKLPDFPPPSMYSPQNGIALFTEHQMQGYANAYGEAVHAALTAEKVAQAEPVGYMMKHKTGMDIGFAWRYHDPQFSTDWARIVYAAPQLAQPERVLTGEQIAALRVAADALIERYAAPIREILANAAQPASGGDRD